MIFEDAHWTDPTSLEMLGRIVDRVSTLPVLLIVTSRPEFDAALDRTVIRDGLTLNRLGARESAAMIARRRREQGSSRRVSGRRSSSARTASRCSWRK